MINRSRTLILLAITVSWGLTACSQVPTGKGIELGNPDPSPITIRITPQGSMTVYDLTLVSENQATVTRIDSPANLRDTLLVPYQREGNVAVLQASFPAHEDIEVTLRFDSEGKVVEATLKINGQKTATEFETLPDLPATDSDSGEPKGEAIKFDGGLGTDEIGAKDHAPLPSAPYDPTTIDDATSPPRPKNTMDTEPIPEMITE